MRFAGAEREVARLREGAGAADVSWLVKLDLKGPAGVPPFGGEAPSWNLGVGHNLAICEPAQRDHLLGRVAATVYCTDVTSVYSALLIAGPRSREVLRKLTSLNCDALREGCCGQASLAHVHATVLRRDLDGIPGFLVLVSREYGESVWDALLHAGHEFSMEPVGLDALRELRF